METWGRAHDRRQCAGLSAREPEGRASRRLHDSGGAERVRDLSPIGWQDGKAGAGPGRGPALESGSRQSAVAAAVSSHRPRGAADRSLTRWGDSTDIKPEPDTKYVRHIHIQ